MGRKILVATDGTPAAMGALRLAGSLAEDRECRVEVTGVVEPLPVFDAGFMVALPEVELYQSRQNTLQARDPRSAGGPGLGGGRMAHHRPLRDPRAPDREPCGGGGCRDHRHGAWAPPSGGSDLRDGNGAAGDPALTDPGPGRAGDGEGFTSLRRVRCRLQRLQPEGRKAALDLMETPWEAHLVHVMSGMEFLPTLTEGWRHDFEEELKSRLGFRCGIVPQRRQSGPRASSGGRACEGNAGLRRREGIGAPGGREPWAFLRGQTLDGERLDPSDPGARIPVLIVPPAERPEDAFLEQTSDDAAHPWVRELQDFTRANAGRRTTMEVMDPELGAQECGRDLALWGVDYDPRE
jgi:hypothetical protein